MTPLNVGPARGLLRLLTVLAFLMATVNAAGPVAASNGDPDTGNFSARWAPGLHFLGTVALAPPSHFNEVLDEMAASQPPVNAGLAALGAYLAVGAHQYSPRIRYTDVLAPELAAQIPVVKKLCENELTIYLTNVQLNGIGNPDWAHNPTLRRFVDTLEPATGRSTGPILLLQGGQDQTVPVAATTTLNTELCGFLGSRAAIETCSSSMG